MKDGKPAYTYNWLGLKGYTITTTEKLPDGKAIVRFEFVYDGGGAGKGGTATILVNGNKVDEASHPAGSMLHVLA